MTPPPRGQPLALTPHSRLQCRSRALPLPPAPHWLTRMQQGRASDDARRERPRDCQATFGRDGAMFEGLLGFVAQLSLVLWGLVFLTVVIRFVGIRIYRRGAARTALVETVAPSAAVPAAAGPDHHGRYRPGPAGRRPADRCRTDPSGPVRLHRCREGRRARPGWASTSRGPTPSSILSSTRFCSRPRRLPRRRVREGAAPRGSQPARRSPGPPRTVPALAANSTEA